MNSRYRLIVIKGIKVTILIYFFANNHRVSLLFDYKAISELQIIIHEIYKNSFVQ